MGPNPRRLVSFKKWGELDTDMHIGRTLCEGSDASTNQGTSKIAGEGRGTGQVLPHSSQNGETLPHLHLGLPGSRTSRE